MEFFWNLQTCMKIHYIGEQQRLHNSNKLESQYLIWSIEPSRYVLINFHYFGYIGISIYNADMLTDSRWSSRWWGKWGLRGWEHTWLWTSVYDNTRWYIWSLILIIWALILRKPSIPMHSELTEPRLFSFWTSLWGTGLLKVELQSTNNILNWMFSWSSFVRADGELFDYILCQSLCSIFKLVRVNVSRGWGCKNESQNKS